jgi:fructoselysine-6-P-deglycase FrlB-like protein
VHRTERKISPNPFDVLSAGRRCAVEHRFAATAGVGDRCGVSKLWADTLAIPDALAATLAAADGFDDVARLLHGARRVIVSGNGAAWYVALGAWLATLDGSPLPAPIVAVPAGLPAAGRFRWQPGDALLAISASGELRDLIEVVDDARGGGRPERVALITATPASSLARRASAVATTRLHDPSAFTHSQAYAANVVACLETLASWSGDDALHGVVEEAADAVARSIAASSDWPREVPVPRMATVFGSGAGWAAALEAALLLREVGRVPAEGTETREAGTSSMFAMARGDLVVSLPFRDDPFVAEAERVCAGTGASVLRAPGCDTGDPRLAPLLAFPASVRLAIALADVQGLDPDAPETAAAYYATARQPPER